MRTRQHRSLERDYPPAVAKGILALLILSPCLWGGETPETEEEKIHEMDPYTVVGTRIRGIDLEKTTPGLKLDAETLDESGFSRVDETLRNLPIMNGDSQEGYVYVPKSEAPGLITVRMRGINAAHLVLINGLRTSPYGGSAFQSRPYDMASIPSSAIEQVEIISDGASAIYGADAISGVINFRTVRYYRGTKIGLGLGLAEGTHSGEISVDLLHGQSVGEHGNLVVSIDYYQRNNLIADEYEYMANTDFRDRGGINWSSTYDLPGAAVVWDETMPDYYQQWVSFEAPTTQPSISGLQVVPDSNDQYFQDGGYNDTHLRDYIGDIEQVGLYLHYDDKLSDRVNASIDFFYRQSWLRQRLAPTPYNTSWLGWMEGPLPAENPFNPLGVERTDGGEPQSMWPVRGRIMDAEPRIGESTTDAPRLVAGLNGEFFDNWNWKVSGVWSDNRSKRESLNGHNWDRFLEALGGIDLDGNGTKTREEYFNPFGYNSSGILDYMSMSSVDKGNYELWMIDAHVDGELLNQPDLIVKTAFGAEFRDEDFAFNPDPQNQAGLRIGGDGQVMSAAGNRNVSAVYGELHLEYRNLITSQIAGRLEQYSDAGNVATPKISVSWKLIPEIMIRGSYGEGFTAPTLPMLNQSETSFYSWVGWIDPKRNTPVGYVLIKSGGNPKLKPQTSTNLAAGLVLEPFTRVQKDKGPLSWLQQLTLGVSYLDIDYDNLVSRPNHSFLLEFEDQLEDMYPGQGIYILRDEPAEGETYGPIIEIGGHYANLAYLRTSSYDFWIELPVDLKDMGKLTLRCDATLTDTANYAGFDVKDTIFMQEWRATARVSWTRGQWSTSWNLQYYDELDDSMDEWAPVKSAIRVNAQVSYAGLWDTRITLGARNLLDQDPPFFEGYFMGAHYLHPTEKRFWYLRFEREF